MRHNEETLRWALDKDTKNLVNISQVKNGAACNCICPVCGTDLIAYQGDKNIHHFQHKQTTNCFNAGETAIHLKAKEIIEKHKKIRLPSCDATATFEGISKTITVSRQKIYTLDDHIITEKKEGKIIPDLIVSYNGNKLLIEIAVTHFIDSEKIKKIKRQNLSCIEINLKEIHKSKENISDEALFDAVIEKVDNKKWIYNKRYAEAKRVALKKAESEKTLKEIKDKKEKVEHSQFITNKVNNSLKNSPSIMLENSKYYESSSNRVDFKVCGKLHSVIFIQNNRLLPEPLDFTVNFNIDTDNNNIEYFGLTIQDTDTDNDNFKRFFKRELQRLSKNSIYNWLSKHSTKISRQ